jgi:DNA-binding ferritin-like protein (Dps family)
LNIKEGNEAWRSHKCREDINSLKRAYKEVITYLNSNGFFGSNVDDSVLEHVVDIFESVTGVTDDEDPNERLETAKSIIRDITKELSLQEVTDIKLIQHEQDN